MDGLTIFFYVMGALVVLFLLLLLIPLVYYKAQGYTNCKCYYGEIPKYNPVENRNQCWNPVFKNWRPCS